ncbi:MAG: chromate transporter [Clostridia bacterium]|nr:chromate transporter [Clostridia bacterium]
MIFIDLFLGFFMVGLFTFGGGYAAIPLIRETVLSYGWLEEETLTYMIAVSESTPGPIMVNLATYIGSSQAGIFGAAVATLAVILPSFVIILFIMSILKMFIHKPYIEAVLDSLKPCIIGIIIATGLYMTLTNIFAPAFNIKNGIIAGILAIVMIIMRIVKKKRISPIMLICLSAILGIAVYEM